MEVSGTDLIALLRTLEVLKPYLNEIVVVGGWVPFLYRKYGELPSHHLSIRTMDIDLAVPRKLDECGRPTIDDLLSRAGYAVDFYGAEISIVKYRLDFPAAKVEFITPEVGRPGKVSVKVQQGLTAQALRYVQILLENTAEIRITETLPDLDVDLIVRLPSPGAFVYQKGLTLSRRHPKDKVSKDLYYIFDFLDSSIELRNSILIDIDSLRGRYATSWVRTFLGNLERYFPEENAEGPALIATQYTGPMNVATFRNYTHRLFRYVIRDLYAIAAQ